MHAQLRASGVLLVATVPVASFPGADADNDGIFAANELAASDRAMTAMLRARVYVVDDLGRSGRVTGARVHLADANQSAFVRWVLDCEWPHPIGGMTLVYELFDPMVKSPVRLTVRDPVRGDTRQHWLRSPSTRTVLRGPPAQPTHPPPPPDIPGLSDETTMDADTLGLLAGVVGFLALTFFLRRRQ
ncbi:MAG: hypothetical protein KC502_02870 [Myxococcales bacterium]|nr:hypothetical protein [Myxococcales bacterium]